MSARKLHFIAFSLLMIFLSAAVQSHATETDQYTLPEKPLEDSGVDVSLFVAEQLRLAVKESNERLEALKLKQKDENSDVEPGVLIADIKMVRSGEWTARRVYERLARWNGLLTPIEEQFEKNRKMIEERKIHPLEPDKSIYSEARWAKAGLMTLRFSPTMRVYDVNLGLDKIGHFFQQGHDYYARYREALARSETLEAAIQIALARGVAEESTMMGKWVSGVYSNADLAANYAGFKFYVNLTAGVKFGPHDLKPMLTFDAAADAWKADEARLGKDLLKPFISEHFDESLNPSAYDWIMASSIRKAIGARAASWIAHHPPPAGHKPSREAIEKRQKELILWHGEKYGHWAGDGLTYKYISILSTDWKP